jgi:hypothetical protein
VAERSQFELSGDFEIGASVKKAFGGHWIAEAKAFETG